MNKQDLKLTKEGVRHVLQLISRSTFTVTYDLDGMVQGHSVCVNIGGGYELNFRVILKNVETKSISQLDYIHVKKDGTRAEIPTEYRSKVRQAILNRIMVNPQHPKNLWR
jgi:hypothetical protein